MLIGGTLALAAACGKDKPAETVPIAARPGGVDAYKKQQAAFADSVIRSAPSARKVAEKLGPKYEIAPAMLRDSIAVLAKDPKRACFEKGKAIDPYLAGVVSMWVNISVIGTDVIRVQESQWSSQVGGIAVDACLNTAAATWKLSSALAKPSPYIVQVVFR
jgi:hypothetical protein